MFNSLGSLIKDIPSRSRSPKAIVALQVRKVAEDIIRSEFADLPTEILSTIKPASFKAGVLTISVKSPLVSGELKMRAGDLKSQINKQLGRNLVRDLRITLK